MICGVQKVTCFQNVVWRVLKVVWRCNVLENVSCFLLGDDSDGDEIRGLTLGFAIPTQPVRPERFRKVELSEEFFNAVPQVVMTALLEVLDNSVPIDVQMPLVYLRSGALPEFVVAWFMAALPKSRVGKTTRFYQALRAIEQLREFVFYGSADDPIEAGGGALAPHLLGVPDKEDATPAATPGEAAAAPGEAAAAPGEAAAAPGGAAAEPGGADPLNEGFVHDSDEEK